MRVSKTKVDYATPHSLRLDIVMSINEYEALNVAELSEKEKDELCMMWGKMVMEVVENFNE